MSDSEASASIPSDKAVENALRTVIGRLFKTHRDTLSLKLARKAAEEEIDLPENFFKSSGKWNARSKEFITAEVERLEEEPEQDSKTPTKKPVKKAAAPPKKPTPIPKQKKAEPTKKAAKHATPDTKPKARKKRKVSVSSESELESVSDGEESALSELSAAASDEESEVASIPTPQKPARTSKKAAAPAPRKQLPGKRKGVESEDESEQEEDAAPPAKRAKTESEEEEAKEEKSAPAAATVTQAEGAGKNDGSESEMSIVLDEPPKKKRQKKGMDSKATKSAKGAKPARKAKEAPEISADDAEIKRLQAWLVKCGIRKLWGKELKPYETPKAKISHLRQMLSDAGMEGRYSNEKAAAIKEQRELAADLEAVQEFGNRWGEDKQEKRMRGARGTNRKIVIDEDDEEESSEEEEDDSTKKGLNKWGIDESLLDGDSDDSD